MFERLQDIFVRLHRPSTVAPWGFRLQGGAGTSTPLSIQRVFSGGVADGQLIRGDILLAVDGRDVSDSPHFVAEEFIKMAGRELLLTIKRASSTPVSPRNEGYVDYPFEMNRGGVEDYEHARNLSEIRQKFNEPTEEFGERGRIQNNAQPGSTSYLPRRPNISKIFANQNSPEYGWVPKPKDTHDYQSRYRPHHIQQVLSNEDKYYSLPRNNIRRVQYEKPAWVGTLRSSGGPKPWELHDGITLTDGRQEGHQNQRHFEAPVSSSSFHVEKFSSITNNSPQRDATRAVHQPKVQVSKFSNKGFSGFEQRPINQAHPNAKVANLQYNTPLSLYSRENAEEIFRSQIGSEIPSGTKPWTHFDPAQSDVCRMIREMDNKRGPHHPMANNDRGHQRSAYLEHLIHENDDQQMSYGHLPQVFKEKMAISDF